MVFKCKMCGGDIEPINEHVGKCLYCKSTMTLPKLDDEKIINLYNRANSLRLNNEFDKAYEMYEKILEIDNEQIEAQWGQVISKYGVEYVDDPATKQKIPTCHRTIDESILTDTNFITIKKKAYGEALEIYKKEAEQINEIQKRILEISSKEEPYDIFICYKETDSNNERTNDSVLAEDIYEKLTNLNYKVFFARITLEDKLGQEYEPYIFSALKSAKVMLVVGTCKENFEAVWVKNEWSRYLEMMKKDKSKTLIPVYSKIDAYELPENFAMLQAQNMDKVGAMQDLTRGIQKIIQASKNKDNIETTEIYQKLKNEIEEKVGDKYEVTVIKEKLSLVYKWTSIVALISIITVAPLVLQGFFYNKIDMFCFSNNTYPLPLIFWITTLIIWIIGLINRKTNKVSKILYTINIIAEIGLGIYWKTHGIILSAFWHMTLLINFLLLCYQPKWNIDGRTKAYLDKEEKEKREKKNEQIVTNFKPRNKNIIKWPILVIILIFICIGIAFTFKYHPEQGNERDTSKEQVQVATEYIRIRRWNETNGPIEGRVYANEIYTVLESREDNEKLWYKIKTKYGITGWICAGNKRSDKYNYGIELIDYDVEKNYEYVRVLKTEE